MITVISVSQEFLDTIEDKEHLLEVYEDMDNAIAALKASMAKRWMFGREDITDSEFLFACGLEY